MARQYKCAACKRGFKNQFALSAHIRFCKEQKTLKCPECRKICSRKGLASHRFSKHGVAGTSRWALKAREVKKSPKAVIRDLKEQPVPIPQPAGIWKDQAIRVAMEKITFHNAEIKALEEYIQLTKDLP